MPGFVHNQRDSSNTRLRLNLDPLRGARSRLETVIPPILTALRRAWRPVASYDLTVRNTAAIPWWARGARVGGKLLGLGWGLLFCSCLQINGDFSPIQEPLTRPNGPEDSTSTGSQTSDLESTSTASQSDSSRSSEEQSSESSTSTTEGSSSSVDSTSTEVFALWVPIEIRNNSGTDALQAQSSVRLKFDHADLVANHRASVDGTNLQIIASDGTNYKELDRVLDPQSRWNDANTEIWFSINKDIAAGALEGQRYYIVIRPLAAAPRQDPSRVFLAYDQFDGSELDTSIWEAAAETIGPGQQRMQVTGGELVLTATASGSGKRTQTVRSVANWEMDAIVMDAAVRTDANLSAGTNCTQEFLTGLWSPRPSTYIRSLFLHDAQGFRYANHRDVEPHDFIVQGTGTRNSTRATQRYSLRWRGPNIEVAVNEAVLDTFFTRHTNFMRPSAGPLIAGFEAVALGGCPGVQSHLAVDWVIVRKAAMSEPTLTLRLKEAVRRDP